MAQDPWKHRSEGMSCKTCMWFVEKVTPKVTGYDGMPVVGETKDSLPGKIGRCRRHAPTMNGYPVVFMSDWCGDHKLDENKA